VCQTLFEEIKHMTRTNVHMDANAVGWCIGGCTYIQL